MTFQEAVAYLTRDGELLLDVLEGIQGEVDRASDAETYARVPVKDMEAYRIVCREMRTLFV